MIEFNHVHHLVHGLLSDAGGIYALGASPGSVIRNNVFHDVWPYEKPPFAWGIYLDATTSGYLVENNVVYHTMSGGVMFNNGGHENEIRNNVFALSARFALWPYWEKRPNKFHHNIVYLTQGDLIVSHAGSSLQERQKAGESLGVWDNNLYWHAGEPGALRFLGRTFEEWQALGLDVHSRIADPRFINPESGDFGIQPDSPALELGFRPIDVSRIGLHGDPSWVDEPRSIQHPKTVLPPPPAPPPPRETRDGFEETPTGAPPRDATVSGEEKGASIRVTDEQAATGGHSLKVTDSKALDPSWQPHFYYEPHFRGGRVKQSFDVRLEPDVRFFTEWRDTSSGHPANVGPSVTIDAGRGILVGGKSLHSVPVGQWLRVEIEATVGKDTPGTFTLSLGVPGRPPRVFRNLPFSGKDFREVHWLGFSSTAAADCVFHLDNVNIESVR